MATPTLRQTRSAGLCQAMHAAVATRDAAGASLSAPWYFGANDWTGPAIIFPSQGLHPPKYPQQVYHEDSFSLLRLVFLLPPGWVFVSTPRPPVECPPSPSLLPVQPFPVFKLPLARARQPLTSSIARITTSIPFANYTSPYTRTPETL